MKQPDASSKQVKKQIIHAIEFLVDHSDIMLDKLVGIPETGVPFLFIKYDSIIEYFAKI